MRECRISFYMAGALKVWHCAEHQRTFTEHGEPSRCPTGAYRIVLAERRAGREHGLGP